MENSETEKNDEESKPIIIRNSTDLQRLKLEKLMKNPEKPVLIPERPKPRGEPVIPDFVRNVMGSSAGAGSGEFHVYRHLRRKEYARQKYMKIKGENERLDDEFQKKLEENKAKAEAKTAKRRAKRLKRKQKLKNKAKKQKLGSDEESKSDESDSETEEEVHTDSKSVSDADEINNDKSSENDRRKEDEDSKNNSDLKSESNADIKDIE